MTNYQEVTKVWFFDKIKSSLAGIIVWPILIIVSVYMLWSNEFSYVAREKAIITWENIVVEIDAQNPSPENNNKYVYTFGEVSSDVIQEPDFLFPINAVSVSRTVEMYQWQENTKTEVKENLWGSETHTTTYSYEKKWSQFPINSDDFNQATQYQNPKNWQYEWKTIFGQNVKLGNFKISDWLQAMMPKWNELPLWQELENMLATGSSVVNNYIYNWVNYNDPQIGDLRISYSILPIWTSLSTLAWQRNNDMLDIYLLDGGENITRIEEWNKSAKILFQAMKDDNSLTTWLIRIAFTVIIFLWLNMLFSILPTLGSIVPFIGKILGVWVWLIALVWTLIIAGGTIAIAWLVARPIISVIIIVLIIWAIFAVKYIISHKKVNNVWIS